MVNSTEHRFQEDLRQAQQRAKKTLSKEKMFPTAPGGEEKAPRNFLSNPESEANFVPQTQGVIDREYFELAFLRYCSNSFSAALKAAQRRAQKQKTQRNYGDTFKTKYE